MSVIFLVLPLAVVLAGTAVLAFLLSARSGQFDDLKTPAWRMLFDGDGVPKAQRFATREQQTSATAGATGSGSGRDLETQAKPTCGSDGR